MTAGEASDRGWMSEALALAQRSLCSTRSMPRGACVLVDGERVVGSAHSRRGLQLCVELSALAQSDAQLERGVCYTALEPAAGHELETLCAALQRRGVRRVVIGARHPDPAHAGQASALLTRAGLEVVDGCLEQQARAVNIGMFTRFERQRPYVRCKLGMSLDGRIAMRSGESKWITSDAAREDVQRLRSRSDAIITGAGTILTDDPSLTARPNLADLDGAAPTQPLRVILDTRGRVPGDARVFRGEGECLLVTKVARRSDWPASLQVIRQATPEGSIDLHGVLRTLAARAMNEVLVEAGATLTTSFIREGLVDEVVLYIAPKILGSSARACVEQTFERLTDTWGGKFREVTMVGDDLRVTLSIE
jgi:diaminohydroxyphosphoribosylaminopyrimidine deaminase/5-amino-6-(5-phosphoribosylamino)uracil reductase